MGYRFAEELVSTEVLKSASCDSCNKEIKVTDYGVKDALPLRMESGYGMFFDAFPHLDPLVLLCEQCVVKLCKQWPVFQQVIDKS